MSIQIKPPFDHSMAREKVQRAEDLWNTRDPQLVARAYSADSTWRNRNEFIQGREQIVDLLQRKWARELDYKLQKQLFLFTNNKIAVQFKYEYHDDSGQWFRAFGLEHWTFDSEGLMQERHASINELAISAAERELI